MAESSRIEELRRRVESDPASLAFAQLAEEFRRAGRYDDAARVCRGGLSKHPTYLSARVTLGRALIELGRYEEAQTELEYVLRSAPENLAAIRGLGEIHQRQGDLTEALRQYQIALALAKHDPELEEAVLDLNRRLGSDASRPYDSAHAGSFTQDERGDALPASAFDLRGVHSPDARQPVPSSSDAPVIPLSSLSPELEAAADEFTKALQALDALSLDLPAAVPFETLSPQATKVEDEPVTNGLPEKEQAVVDELESWLQAIRNREGRPVRS